MERIARDQLLVRIRADRAAFDAIVDRVPAERRQEPMLPGGWSVKDVLAHIAWGDREAIGVIRAHALVGSPLWDLPQEERNEAVVRERRSRPLDEVVAEYRSSFEDLVEGSPLSLTTSSTTRIVSRVYRKASRVGGLGESSTTRSLRRHGRAIATALAAKAQE